MAVFGCNCRNNCTGLAVIASIIIGIIAAFLQITAVIAVTPAFLWVVFGIAIVYLAVALLTLGITPDAQVHCCICSVLPALLTGILGTVLAAVILLAITFAATSVIGAIIVGALLFFFSLTITSTACLVRCLARCNN